MEFYQDEVPQPKVATPDNTHNGRDHYTLTAHVGTHSFSPANDWPEVTTLGYSASGRGGSGGAGGSGGSGGAGGSGGSGGSGGAGGSGGSGGSGGGVEMDFLGPTIITRQGRPADVKVINALPPAGTQIFPFDQPNNDNTLTLHRHGGLQPAESDGAPAPIGVEVPPGGSQTQHYPNNQAAAPLWYHDHIDAQTSYHAYEGLAGFIPNTDRREQQFGLPTGDFAKAYVLQDKSFNADKTLCYSHADPEFFGDLPVINGIVAPKQTVEPRRYTFTFINGSDSRFYRLSLRQTGGSTAAAPKMTVVAGDSGYLLHPAVVKELLVAPGERYKVVIDFTGHRSQKWVVTNNAPAPFGALDGVDPDGAGIPQLMRFDVGPSTSSPDRSRVPGALPESNNQLPPAAILAKARLRTVQAGEVIPGAPQLGDKVQLLNYGPADTATETPQLNSTEAWAMRNHSPDSHPIHLHLVELRLIGRWPVTKWSDTDPDTGTQIPLEIGQFVPPAPYETGPKETFVAPPDYITVWAGKFTVGGSSVWHCHIMSHEDGASTGGAIEMMRPLVIGNKPQTQLPLIHNQVRLDKLIRQP
ncbi:multicopper oxidase domain-containing protein [Nonomuraea sp. NPDC049695]|uniref:multicopper oxidase family protein n=1 Tax=Nonomuraea sp. NPDC049695 TaxID=3154734 RepID=UPI00342A362B